MLRTRTDLWRLALFTSLGLFPNACGGESAGDNDNPSEHRTDEGADAAVNSGPGIPDAGSAPSLDASSSPATDAGAEAGTDVGSTTMDPAPDGAAPNPSSGTDGGAPNGTQCSDLVHGTVYTGLKQCDDGVVHRPDATQVCESILPRPAPEAADGAPPIDEPPISPEHECKKDTDCTESPHGYCRFAAGESLPVNTCFYGCVSDADCASDEACVCGNPVGTCVSATCRDDDDCSPGMKCAQWVDPNLDCYQTYFLSCQSPEDECISDADCDQSGDGNFCSGASGVRYCEPDQGLICGRPFLIAGSERLAELTRGEGWLNEAAHTTAQLGPLPAGVQAPGKMPMVLLPHGGPHVEGDRWGFDTDAQFLASRGYLVLQVNYRGSRGRGYGFQQAGFHQWGGRIQEDLVDGVRWAVAQGHADPGRICAYGASFGAYSAMMVAARAPDLIRCAAGLAGLYDLKSFTTRSDTARSSGGRAYFRRAVGSGDDYLRENSPTALAAAITAPVFLAHGELDERTPYSQAVAMKKALEDAGRPPEWMAVPREGHGFYSDENNIEFYRRLEAFLDRHIGAG